jgi:undecaprenyl-phosphate 4-deoxy-4-formamido-L-arabinose transferase
MVSLSVIVPCYRSSATLPALVGRLLPVLDDTVDAYQVVLVVDGSPDDTADTARALAARHPGVEAIELSRNYGQHNALLAGIRAARHELVVTMDDDLQHRPETVPLLVGALSPDLDLVYGTSVEEEHGFFRSAASRTVKRLMARGMKVASAKDISAFRVFRTELRDGLRGLEGPHLSIDVALSWATTRIGSAEVPMDERTEGASNYSFRMLVRHAANMILGYSTVPLRLVAYLGFLFGMFGVIMLGVVLVQYFSGSTTVKGYTALASMIAIFSGAQMVAVGVLGEYLAQVHSRSMGKPAYVISTRVRSEVVPSNQVSDG